MDLNPQATVSNAPRIVPPLRAFEGRAAPWHDYMYGMSSGEATQWFPDITGKHIVVTGANSGLGFASTRQLAARGARVTMACSNLQKAETARAAILRDFPSAKVDTGHLDLASLTSIRAFARTIESSGNGLDVLLNNAGVMATDHVRTEEGFEMQIGVNHLGHFAVTALLLPVLAHKNGRIVNVSSLGHRRGNVVVDDLMFDRRRYNRWSAYFQSKLANLLFTHELHRRLEDSSTPVTALAAHPGTAKTEIGRVGTSFTNVVMNNFTGVLIRDAHAGAVSQVRASVDPSLTGGELVGPRWLAFGLPRLETPSRRARDSALAKDLWAASEELTRVTYGL